MSADHRDEEARGAATELREARGGGWWTRVERVATFVAILWGVFLVSRLLPLLRLGLVPRDREGLIGILTMPFLHRDLAHLTANTLPLVVLLFLVTLLRRWPLAVALGVAVPGGALLWLVGRPGVHVGASGLVFGLAAYLVVAAWRDARPLPIVIALAVAGLYGASMLAGVLPWTVGRGVSWDGHLTGAIGGVLWAIAEPRTFSEGGHGSTGQQAEG